jgi:hypothetical protein
LLHIGIQLGVSPSLFFGAVAHEAANNPLVDSLARHCRNERMPENMQPSPDTPFRGPQGPVEVLSLRVV